jgi:DNA polymerase elongation subunit (family B)
MAFSERYDRLLSKCNDLSKLSDDELISLYKDAEIVRKEYENLQLVVKCNANSLYGVLVYAHFSMRDSTNANDITTTGSHLTRLVDSKLNKYFSTWVSTDKDNVLSKINNSGLFPTITDIINLKYVPDTVNDICVYGDTDSRYIDIGQIYSLIIANNAPLTIPEDNGLLTDQILWLVDAIIMPVVNRTIDEESEYRNIKAHGQFKMAHEVITRKSILLKKKRYVMTVIWKDGKSFTEPKFKYTGVEIKRGSMSPLSKRLLKKLLDNFLLHGHNTEQLRKDLINICNHIRKKGDKNYIYLVTSVTYDDKTLTLENGVYTTKKNHIQMQILANWANFITELKETNDNVKHLKLPFSGQKVNYYYCINSKYKVIGIPDDVDFDDVPNLPEPNWSLMLFHVLIRPFLKYLSDTDTEITEAYAQSFMAGIKQLY